MEGRKVGRPRKDGTEGTRVNIGTLDISPKIDSVTVDMYGNVVCWETKGGTFESPLTGATTGLPKGTRAVKFVVIEGDKELYFDMGEHIAHWTKKNAKK